MSELKCSCGNSESLKIKIEELHVDVKCLECGRQKKIPIHTDFDSYVSKVLIEAIQKIRDHRIATEFLRDS